jgi:multiple sugar transport system ATP-binding protein
MLELEPLLDRRPGQLSGGQRQRVALGRALVREPAVFLFDEPLSNLDARLRLEIRDLIASLHQRLGATMVFVTHDQVEAMSLGERIAVMRDGRLQQIGAPLDVYGEPATLFVARFIGSPPINLAGGVLGHDGGGRVFMADGLTIAGASEGDDADAHDARPVTLAVRPEAIALVRPDAADADVRRTVRRVEPLGSEVLVHVEGIGEDGDADPWIVRVAPDRAVRPGEIVGLRIDAARTHVFDAADGARIGFLGTREAEA